MIFGQRLNLYPGRKIDNQLSSHQPPVVQLKQHSGSEASQGFTTTCQLPTRLKSPAIPLAAQTYTLPPVSRTKLVSPPPRSASRIKLVSPPSRPVSRTKLVSPPSRPASRIKLVSPPSRPASRTELVSPPSRPASRTELVSLPSAELVSPPPKPVSPEQVSPPPTHTHVHFRTKLESELGLVSPSSAELVSPPPRSASRTELVSPPFAVLVPPRPASCTNLVSPPLRPVSPELVSPPPTHTHVQLESELEAKQRESYEAHQLAVAEKEAEKLAWSELVKKLYVTTYQSEFQGARALKPVVMRSSAKPVDAIVMGGTAKAQSPWYLTSTKQAYPPPALVSSNLRTKGTHRHTYTDRRVAVGVLPTANIDMYTEPEYTTPSYTTDFCDPSMR